MEIWKEVKGYEGLYEVSNMGGFIYKSKERKGKGGCVVLLNNRRLKVSNNIHNYIYLGLTDGNKKIRTSLHRVVFESFNHKIPLKMVVNHKNGIKNDNRVDNLECVSQSENIIHAYKNGLIVKQNVKIH
jgi:hypothetical protein